MLISVRIPKLCNWMSHSARDWPAISGMAACSGRPSHSVSHSVVPVTHIQPKPGRKRSWRSSASLPDAEVSSTLTRLRESRWWTRCGFWQWGWEPRDRCSGSSEKCQ